MKEEKNASKCKRQEKGGWIEVKPTSLHQPYSTALTSGLGITEFVSSVTDDRIRWRTVDFFSYLMSARGSMSTLTITVVA